MTTTRAEHIAWAKKRALGELDADPSGNGLQNALSSVLADLRKHPETARHPAMLLDPWTAWGGRRPTPQEVRDWIGGVG